MILPSSAADGQWRLSQDASGLRAVAGPHREERIMKLIKMAGAALLGTALLATGCDGSSAPEGLSNEAAAPTAEAVNEAAAPVADEAGTVAAATKVAPGAADLNDEALKTVAIPDRPMKDPGAMCELVGNAGDTVSCAVKLGADADGIAARALQGTIAFDGARASLKGYVGEVCGADGNCIQGDLEAAGLKSGHTFKSSPIGDAAKNGRATFMVFHPAAPQTPISEAGSEAAAEFMNVAFVLSQDVRADNPVEVTLGNVVVSDEAANAVSVRVEGASILTSGLLK